ncbi:hypothetical protein INT44_001306 [Umbelopsis vinacea]|uniref:F-box domain-containing protein n=1 Tax=Umbelopsis vinacea TaxID=44442 RepID=A0A8H7Q9M7_9FUNG|nr:hypothetical protein INT44_001306 [Umbelopsis vinacea]
MSLSILPTEIILIVLQQLETKDVWAVERTAHRMRTIALLDISRRMKFITAHWQFKINSESPYKVSEGKFDMATKSMVYNVPPETIIQLDKAVRDIYCILFRSISAQATVWHDMARLKQEGTCWSAISNAGRYQVDADIREEGGSCKVMIRSIKVPIREFKALIA